MARETWVQSQVESYQRLKNWYLMPPCLTLSIIRYRSRVKWSNPGKGVVPSPTPRCSIYQKGRLWVTLDLDCQLYFLLFFYNWSCNLFWSWGHYWCMPWTEIAWYNQLSSSANGCNSKFFFSLTSCHTKVKEISLPYCLRIAGGRIVGSICFQRVLAR